MGWASYEAKRELAFNHFAGTTYTLGFELTEFHASGADLKNEQKSISGEAVEVQYFGTEKKWKVTLAPIDDIGSESMREFLASTADGQVFSFDPSGTATSPSRRLMQVKRSDEGATEAPFGGMGSNEDMVQFSFEIRRA